MSRLKKIVRNVNVDDIAAVEKYLYDLNVSNNYRNKLFLAYQCYCNANNIPYKKPKNQRIKSYVIHVPTEERINTIIACCGWVYSVVYSLSKYGLRPQEISNLTLRDFDLETFVQWISDIKPILVHVGYDNYSNNLVEPSLSKTKQLIDNLRKFTAVKILTLREKVG